MFKIVVTNEYIAKFIAVLSLLVMLYYFYEGWSVRYIQEQHLFFIAVFGTSAWLAYKTMKSNNILAWFYIVIATLFNPIFNMPFKRNSWVYIIVFSIIVNLYELMKKYIEGFKTAEQKGPQN